MTTLSVEKKNAVIAFNNADDKGKKLLTDLFGKANISGNIMDMVKNYEDACALEGTCPIDNLPYLTPKNDDDRYLNAIKKSIVIVRVLNGDWKANYADKDQNKWYVWMRYDSSLRAFVFNFTYNVYTHAHAGTGSRHVFKDAETAKYFATQFADVINAALL